MRMVENYQIILKLSSNTYHICFTEFVLTGLVNFLGFRFVFRLGHMKKMKIYLEELFPLGKEIIDELKHTHMPALMILISEKFRHSKNRCNYPKI